MARKKKCGTAARNIHLREVDSCVALVLEVLPLKEIIRAKRVSKWFGKRCCEALGLMTEFNWDKHGLRAECLRYLLAYCRNIEVISRAINIQNIGNVFGALRSWRHLKELNLDGAALQDISLQELIIPQIAEWAPKLELLSLIDIPNARDLKVYLAPLCTLKHLKVFGFIVSEDKGVELVGLDNLLRNCPIAQLTIGTSSDFFTAVNACDTATLQRLKQLILICDIVTTANCATVARFSNLRRLMLFSHNISNDGIPALSSLQHLRRLGMSFDNLTPTGMSFLTNTEGFAALKKLTWYGNLQFDDEWLQVLERSHGGVVLQHH